MATRKRTVSRKKSTNTRKKHTYEPSFRVVKDTIPFTSTQFTRQTFYWILILAFIVVMQIWIIKLQTDLGNLTNSMTVIQQENN
jgi:hypothetical protein